MGNRVMSVMKAVPYFGVAGFPPDFFDGPLCKKRENIFLWLEGLKLDWIELQCTRGVKMKAEQARLYRELAQRHGIGISIHGPYFISLASGDKEVVERSRERIMQCVALAGELGTGRIVFHPGYFPGRTQEDRRAAIKQIVGELNGLKHDIPKGVYLLPETAGKRSQIGSLDEILEICQQVEFARPCIDLAHVHAFDQGSLWTERDITEVLCRVGTQLGSKCLDRLHIHMYPVDFGIHGEKGHRAFDDCIEPCEQLSVFGELEQRDRFYPRAEHFVETVKRLNIHPVVICEAYNTQNIGAALMKKLYFDGE